jgi:tRNA threonylcarbamoyl adenosine modification protein YeaZ
MLLAFDTATAAVTAAVHDGDDVLAETTSVGPLRHGELLAPAIETVLSKAGIAPADLTRIAVGVGPGPFTGLRVGLVTARTMADVLGIPAVGVVTLDVIAAAVEVGEPFAVATDARRREVYWARYDAQGARLVGPDVCRPADVATSEPVAGRGPVLYPDAFPHPVAPVDPRAADLARAVVAGTLPLLPVEPLYLRRPDVAEAGTRKRVR